MFRDLNVNGNSHPSEQPALNGGLTHYRPMRKSSRIKRGLPSFYHIWKRDRKTERQKETERDRDYSFMSKMRTRESQDYTVSFNTSHVCFSMWCEERGPQLNSPANASVFLVENLTPSNTQQYLDFEVHWGQPTVRGSWKAWIRALQLHTHFHCHHC